MTESFLILLSAGVLLAAAISDPQQVTLLWLRLCGIIALAVASLSFFFFFRRTEARLGVQLALYGVTFAAILCQLAFVQVAHRGTQRFFAAIAFIVGAILGSLLIAPHSGLQPMLLLSALGISAVVGLALMDMLLGHAYLTASRMTMAPFKRLNLALLGVIAFRLLCSAGLTMLLLSRTPIELFWGRFGIFVLTRWLVGLVLAGVFVLMAHDCIRRRSTQSATGILYVAGLLIFIGEIVALHLVRETSLPF